MPKLEELRLDVEELKQLLSQASRPKVKDILSLDIRKLETEIIALESPEEPKPTSTLSPSAGVVAKHVGCYDVKITNYAWDQSDKFVKIYVTLKNVHNLQAENVRCDFTSKSMNLVINGLDGKNYSLLISNLMSPIIPNESYFKVKTDVVTVFMKKQAQKSWSHITVQEKKAKESKVPKPEEGDDPSKSLMDLMKQMYEDGDDEMKRTIAKAWTESREKNAGLGEL